MISIYCMMQLGAGQLGAGQLGAGQLGAGQLGAGNFVLIVMYMYFILYMIVGKPCYFFKMFSLDQCALYPYIFIFIKQIKK